MIIDWCMNVAMGIVQGLLGLFPEFILPENIALPVQNVVDFISSLNWLLPVQEGVAVMFILIAVRIAKAVVLWILKFIPTMG